MTRIIEGKEAESAGLECDCSRHRETNAEREIGAIMARPGLSLP
jgi:hypothetical protein